MQPTLTIEDIRKYLMILGPEEVVGVPMDIHHCLGANSLKHKYATDKVSAGVSIIDVNDVLGTATQEVQDILMWFDAQPTMVTRSLVEQEFPALQ